MTFKKALAAIAIIACSTTFGFADSDTQLFTVTVPVAVTITPPSAQTLPHTENNTDVLFDDQAWSVVANDIDGSAVTFVAAPFQISGGASKRDTKLDLSIASQIGYGDATNLWTVGTSSAQTDFNNATPVTTATVAAASTNAANAVFNLDVTFITGTYGTFASGTYTTTVTGTITAN